MDDVVVVKNLSKSYDGRKILDDISFSLGRGKCLAVLGVNGAGKSTMLETMEGLRKLTNGKITILGFDIEKDHRKVQEKTGIQLQKNSLFDLLSVKENVSLYMGLYGRKPSASALKETLEEFNLLAQEDVAIRHLSGGQFQRLKLCLSLINRPDLLFLDEPTTGLDPGARNAIWRKVMQLKEAGTSIIITTHHMEEAEALCDRVAILHNGKFIVDDTPEALVQGAGFPRRIVLDMMGDNVTVPEGLKKFDCMVSGTQIYINTNNIAEDFPAVLRELENSNLTYSNLSVRQADLEDVFMRLTNSKFEGN